MNPDRIVLGHADPGTLELLRELYSPWSCDKLEVNTRTAEMIKYAKQLPARHADLGGERAGEPCGGVGGIDILDVMRGIHLDKRWSPLLPDGRRVSPQILTYLIPAAGSAAVVSPRTCKPSTVRDKTRAWRCDC